jgi:hypothetical protein
MSYIDICNYVWHWTQNDYTFKVLIYTYIIIRLFLEELHRHLSNIYEWDSGNKETVHIYWQTNKIYGASESDLNIDYI